MKIKTLFLALAAMATLFAACSKDDDSKTNPGGGPAPELAPNVLVVGTQQYQMHPTLSVTNEGYYLFDANDPNGHYNILADVPSTLLGQTLNLAQLSGADRFYISFSTPDLSFGLQTGDQPISVINGEEVSTVFTEGTMQFTNENGIMVLHVSGTLSNGTYVGFIMSVPVEDIEPMDYQIILDGQVYPADCIARHRRNANLSYEMRINSQGGTYIGVCVEVDSTAFDHTIDLTQTTSVYCYRVKVYFQDTTATQDAFTGTVESSYWDIPAQTDYPQVGCLFTRGTLYPYRDEYAVGFTISGTLTNGHTVSAQLRVSKPEIIEE